MGRGVGRGLGRVRAQAAAAERPSLKTPTRELEALSLKPVT